MILLALLPGTSSIFIIYLSHKLISMTKACHKYHFLQWHWQSTIPVIEVCPSLMIVKGGQFSRDAGGLPPILRLLSLIQMESLLLSLVKWKRPRYRPVWLGIFLCSGNYGDLESGQDCWVLTDSFLVRLGVFVVNRCCLFPNKHGYPGLKWPINWYCSVLCSNFKRRKFWAVRRAWEQCFIIHSQMRIWNFKERAW